MNVQNLPRDFISVKQAFLPKLDAFLFFDYKNIEPRLFGHFLSLAGDDSIARDFREGRDDPYIQVAQRMWPGTEIDSKRRQMAKTIYLATLYGAGYAKIQQSLIKVSQEHWTFPQAKALVEQMHAGMPGIRYLQNQTERTLKSRGYLRTPWGRHLHVDAPHKALNAIIQGSAADLMKWAALQVHRKLKTEGYRTHIVNLIHDEIMIDAAMEEVPDVVVWVPKLMVYPPINEIVPIHTDVEWSTKTWADKEEYHA